ncbi:BZ3500_MvSof-1268-A1-R1_Chr10-1g02653 [Microbotryum saponariae]|uniref:BZ3500_MvSof-1268-A1-R1_Chr10-1g02653 protein n=1 Tax=Microbotryum saponariae TaxID=289078 RepID=A0A2X0NEW3_9BASI|nr:BZ3500_MvSof-1268-A1-R1_Chr10-1g02653 [Microbotryum saponariae]SDA06142.1 BZ3501_MvSof-1269-A2-R1_Chr10-1g02254 [Microbotryum saponariae]
MGFFGNDERDAHNAVYGGQEHESSWSHELIAGAAAFEAEKAYERHVSQNGRPANHQLAKELLAGFAGAETDKLFETKGLDFLDREKAKRQAREQAEQAVSSDNY